MSSVERIAKRLGVTFLSLAVVSLVVVCAARAQCGQEYRGAPPSSTVPGGPPLAIGDSVLADAVSQLVRYGFEADGMVCRQMSQGVTLLRARGARLPHLVVLALGANGEVTDKQIGEALTLLGPKRVLVLVTPHGGVLASTPDVIRAAAAADPSRIVLLDWDRLAGEHKDWLAPDGVHLGGSAGIEGFAAMIASVLPYATATPVGTEAQGKDVEPGTPETLPSSPVHHPHARRKPHAKKPSNPRGASSAKAPAALPILPATHTETARKSSSGSAPGLFAAVLAAIALVALVLLALLARRRMQRRDG